MTNKDWTGDTNSVFKTLGASNHSKQDRETHDWYATNGIAADILCNIEKFEGDIWEPAAGSLNLSERFIANGYNVISTDLVDRGYKGCLGGIDFLKQDKALAPNIITNPPYSIASEFVYKALELIPDNGKVAMFLKLLFLEGKKRKRLFEEHPPTTIYVSSSRIDCAKNNDFKKLKENGGGAQCYCWYIWHKNFKGDTILKWVN